MPFDIPIHLILQRLELTEACLFVDLDGTLAEIQPRPGDVKPQAERTALLLDACERMGGRVAVISGRPIRELDHILEEACISVAGLHGLERRTSQGEQHAWTAHPAIANAAEAFEALAKARPGLFVEAKGQSVALHYRAAPEAGEAVCELAARLAEASGLDFLPGSMVAELRTPGADKGTAVLSFLRETPFKGSVPIYIGDDVTDEAAFRAVAARDGIGILVGEPRRTTARARLASPQAVRDWLRAALTAGAFDLKELEWLD
jgi:trehalose 6-phosphate phosphatase